MQGRRYSQSGNSDKTYGDVEDNSTFDISGNGDAIFRGTIGNNVVIRVSGNGDVKIRGSVSPSVKFLVSGCGDLKFTARPPQSVLDNMQVSGSGDVSVPGGYKRKSAPKSSVTTFVGHVGGNNSISNLVMDSNGTRYTDANGKQVVLPPGHGPISIGGTSIGGNSGSSIIQFGNVSFGNTSDSSSADSDSPDNSPVVARKKLPAVKPAAIRPVQANNDLSEATTAYLKRLRDHVRHSELIESLGLNPIEADSFKQFLDPLTATIMDEPVILNGRAYDLPILSRIVADAEGYRRDPYSNFKFVLLNLQPALELVNKLHETIAELHRNRQNAHAANTVPAPVQKDEIKDVLHDFSAAMQAYINSFKDKTKNSVLYTNLTVTEAEKKSLEQFEDFFDSVSLELIDIPVAVNGNTYDLQTLLDQPAIADGQREEPNTRLTFYLRDIQPARHIANAIQRELEKLQKMQKIAPAKAPQDDAEASPSRANALRMTAKAEQEAAALLGLLPSPQVSQAPNAVMFRQLEQRSPEITMVEADEQPNCLLT